MDERQRKLYDEIAEIAVIVDRAERQETLGAIRQRFRDIDRSIGELRLAVGALQERVDRLESHVFRHGPPKICQYCGSERLYAHWNPLCPDAEPTEWYCAYCHRAVRERGATFQTPQEHAEALRARRDYRVGSVDGLPYVVTTTDGITTRHYYPDQGMIDMLPPNDGWIDGMEGC